MERMSKEAFRRMIEEMMCPTLPYRSVEKDYDDTRYHNPEICKKCGGECCQRCGCEFSPDDFKEISFEYLKEQLEKGYISITYVDSETIYDDIGVYFLRMRNQGMPIVDLGIRRAPCILWNEATGCPFDYEHRPSGGRLLIPTEETTALFNMARKCASTYSIRNCCYEWKPHQRILLQLVEYFKDKDIPCSL